MAEERGWSAFRLPQLQRRSRPLAGENVDRFGVGRLAKGPRRFGELRRDIAGISPKVLTQKLRELERDGVLTRRIYASVPPKVEYRLTPLGETLIGLLDAIRVWSETHIEAVVAAQQRYDAQENVDTGEDEAQ